MKGSCVALCILLCSIAIAFPVYAQSGAFQGLSWHSSQRTVERTYVGQYKIHDCKGTTAKVAVAMGYTCDNPYIPTYPVVGVPFELNFLMSPKGHGLVGVDLNYASILDSEHAIPANNWQLYFSKLYHALRQRYGKPSHKNTSQAGHTIVKQVEWLTTNTVIKFRTIVGLAYEKVPPSISYVVMYRPRDSGEASKL